jgi:mono/diheme cytochrome c family protein
VRGVWGERQPGRLGHDIVLGFETDRRRRTTPLRTQHCHAKVWAGHGDTKALGSAAPGVVSASHDVRVALTANHPCRARLVKASALMSTATTELTSAAHQLKLLAAAAAASGGKDYSGFQSQFLTDWFEGYPDFEQALTSLRAAGVPGVISATDGKHIFTEAGCAMCHTLKAAGASGAVGPDLDATSSTRTPASRPANTSAPAQASSPDCSERWRKRRPSVLGDAFRRSSTFLRRSSSTV